MEEAYIKTINQFTDCKLNKEELTNVNMILHSYKQHVIMEQIFELWCIGAFKFAKHLAENNLDLNYESLNVILDRPQFHVYDADSKDKNGDDIFVSFIGDIIEQHEYKNFYD